MHAILRYHVSTSMIYRVFKLAGTFVKENAGAMALVIGNRPAEQIEASNLSAPSAPMDSFKRTVCIATDNLINIHAQRF